MNSETERGQRSVVLERRYHAHINDVWSLWTTKEGFESWWGPQGFRAAVREINPTVGGALRYEMIADTPEMVAAMKLMGRPASHPTNARFTEIKPQYRIVITNIIDFLPGVAAYETQIAVDLAVDGEYVRMTVTLDALHSTEMTRMQEQGFLSQLTKLDTRFTTVTRTERVDHA